MTDSMLGVFLPGNSTAEVRTYPIPEPGPGQVVIKTGASGLCGSDIGFIYHGYKTHKGLNGAAAYRGVICGHEPAGQIVAAGPGLSRFSIGDRVLVYHIVGCGRCRACRSGYFISCDGPGRAAYGWQRDGGNAEYILVDESTCVPLPEPLTYVDGSLIACGFGTAYEGLIRCGISGADDLLVVGAGPVGMAAAMIGRMLGARRVIGVERSPERIKFVTSTGLFDEIVLADETTGTQLEELSAGRGFAVTVDCSGTAPGRSIALDAAAEWGRVGLLGEGGRLETEVSDLILHKHLTITGSWVTSVQGMETLTLMLAGHGLHPEVVVSHRFPIEEAAAAYELAAAGAAGKVVIVPAQA